MKSIEKSLTNYLNGTAPRVSEEVLINYASKSSDKANEIIDILFNVINYDLDSYNGEKSLEKIRDLIKCINTVMLNNSDVDRGIIARKTRSLDYKLEHLTDSNKAKIINFDKANREIEVSRLTLDTLGEQVDTSETTQYDFVDRLITTIKDIAYIESVISKDSSLLKVKDKKKTSLFENIIIKYMKSIGQGNEEDAYYYSNLLRLIMHHDDFHLSDKDKKKCLEIIYNEINHMSYNKKKKKQNTAYIDFLNTLLDGIKGEQKTVKIDGLAKMHNISISFSPEIIIQANSVKNKVGTMTGREFVSDYAITIDKEDAVEIDDALTCKILPNGNYLLGVHIASVLGYFSWDSDIVKEAIDRGRSIYLPRKYQEVEDDYERVIPIFPYSFSAQTASLLPNEKRLARSYFYEIDKYGNIVNEVFKKTIVMSNMKTSYEQIDEVLRKGSKNKELEELVKNLYEVTELINKKYHVKEMYEKMKANTDDFSDLPVKNIGAQKIINMTMLLNNHRAGGFFKKNGYPCLYRVQDDIKESDARKLQAMIDSLRATYGGEAYEQLFKQINLNGFYPKARYDIEGSHYGLGLDHYGHFTSPIRRGPDIVNEHALEVCYDKEPTDEEMLLLQHEITIISREINAKQMPIDLFISDYKYAYQKRR